MKKEKIIMRMKIGVIAILAVGCIGYAIYENDKKLEESKEEVIQQAYSICEFYEIMNSNVTLTDSIYEGRRLFRLTVKGEGVNVIGYENTYLCVSELYMLDVDYENSSTIVYVYLDDAEYALDSLDSSILKREWKDVYTYRTDEEKAYLRKIATELPTEGMSGKYINNTILGKADEEEKCSGYENLKRSRRYITYKWYYPNGNLKARVIIDFDESILKDKGYGYVRSVDTYEEKKDSSNYHFNSNNSWNSYDEGYEDIYMNEDYDWDRYYSDPDYANGVEDAILDYEYEYGEGNW